MIKAEIDKNINLVKVETEGGPQELEAELIAIMGTLAENKIFSTKDLCEMAKMADEYLQQPQKIIEKKHDIN